MKDGCAPEGSCGACTVLVNGRAVVSCAQDAARVAGARGGDARGTAGGDPRPVGRTRSWPPAPPSAGIARPGIVMKAEATLARDPAPTRDDLARALAANLCRCTGYVKVLDALETVAAVRAASAPRPSTPRTDGRRRAPGPIATTAAALVLGESPFVRDMVVPGMLHGAVVLSAHPRALVRRIDTAARRAGPGRGPGRDLAGRAGQRRSRA